jgi:hypothetical protein
MDRWTDTSWWQKLTWLFGAGEVNMSIIHLPRKGNHNTEKSRLLQTMATGRGRYEDLLKKDNSYKYKIREVNFLHSANKDVIYKIKCFISTQVHFYEQFSHQYTILFIVELIVTCPIVLLLRNIHDVYTFVFDHH